MRTVSKIIYLIMGIVIVGLAIGSIVAGLALVGQGQFDSLIHELEKAYNFEIAIEQAREYAKYFFIAYGALYAIGGIICIGAFIAMIRNVDRKSLHVTSIIFGIIAGNIWLIIAGITGLVGFNR